MEWAEQGVRVNSITPGFFPAEQNRRLLFEEDGSPTPRAVQILSHTPMNRFGMPEELVGAAVEPTAFQQSLPPAPDGADIEGHLRLILAELLPQVWRRPVGDNEIDRLLSLAMEMNEQAPTLETALRTSIVAMLVSPNFLLRVEDDPRGSTPEPLSGYELATRLSYFLWSTTPDEQLLEAAARGSLATPAGRRAQVDRMIRSDRSRALAEHFATQWLQIRSVDEKTPDPRRYPGVAEALHRSLQEETIELFDTVYFEVAPVPDSLGGFLRNNTQFGLRVASMGFDLEPDAELVLRFADFCHLGSAVAWDHGLVSSSCSPCGRS